MRLMKYFVVAFAIALVGGRAAFAQTTPINQVFTLQPGAQTVITFEGFCTEFGKTFPTSVEAPNGAAPANVVAGLSYAQGKGYTTTEQQALEVQYAIWQLLGTQGAPTGGAIAQEVVTNAKTAPTTPQGTSLLNAVQANQVRVTVSSWQPLGSKVAITASASDYFYGRGTLTVENTSQQALTLYMPIGTIFPASDNASQDMTAYFVSAQASGSTATQPAATTAATVAATTAATVAPTTAATTAATVAPTTAATTAATVAPTTAATTAATTVATTAATTTSAAGQAPNQLPTTGDDGGNSWALLLGAFALAFVAGGLLLRARPNR